MRILCLTLCLFSFNVLSSVKKPVEIVNEILSSSNIVKSIEILSHPKKESLKLERELNIYGKVTDFNCYPNYHSDSFDTVACHIVQQKLKNGAAWEFYFYLDGSKWIGTKFTVVQYLPQGDCIDKIELNKGVDKGFKYLKVQC